MLDCDKCKWFGNKSENDGVKKRIKIKNCIIFCPKGHNYTQKDHRIKI